MAFEGLKRKQQQQQPEDYVRAPPACLHNPIHSLEVAGIPHLFPLLTSTLIHATRAASCLPAHNTVNQFDLADSIVDIIRCPCRYPVEEKETKKGS